MVQGGLAADLAADREADQLRARRQAVGEAVGEMALMEPDQLSVNAVGIEEGARVVEHPDDAQLSRQPARRRRRAVDVRADGHGHLDDLAGRAHLGRPRQPEHHPVVGPRADLLKPAAGRPVLGQQQPRLLERPDVEVGGGDRQVQRPRDLGDVVQAVG